MPRLKATLGSLVWLFSWDTGGRWIIIDGIRLPECQWCACAIDTQRSHTESRALKIRYRYTLRRSAYERGEDYAKYIPVARDRKRRWWTIIVSSSVWCRRRGIRRSSLMISSSQPGRIFESFGDGRDYYIRQTLDIVPSKKNSKKRDIDDSSSNVDEWPSR